MMELDIPWVVDEDDVFHYDDSERMANSSESDPVNPPHTFESQNDNRDPRRQRQSLVPAASGVDERRPARPLPQYLLDREISGEGVGEDDNDDEENEDGFSYVSPDEGESEVYEEALSILEDAMGEGRDRAFTDTLSVQMGLLDILQSSGDSGSLDVITRFEEVGMRLHLGDGFGDGEGISDDEDDEDSGEWCGRGRRDSGDDERYLTRVTDYSCQESRRSLGFRSDPRVDIMRSAFVGVAQWAQGRT